jgi:transcriptional regulator with XRE-family HTH domain
MTSSVSSPQLSAALVAYLRQQGKNLREIGELVGLSESFVSRVANGQRSFTIDHLALFEQSVGEPLPALILQAMWARDPRPEQQSEFDAALQLLRDLGRFRRSLGEERQSQDRDRMTAKRADHGRSRRRKRAAG